MRLLDILTSPWAIVPDKLREIQAVYRAHIRGEKIDVKGIQAKVGQYLDDHRDDDRGYDVADGIAVIPIQNVITKKRTLFSFFFGGSSSGDIKVIFQSAVADPGVKAILLYIDSPGGTVEGTQELADYIHANKGGLPVYAFSDGIMTSAAYWIGAAADKIYISSDTVEVGSIGVVATHIDQSKWDEMMGDRYTEITAGRYKRIASAHGPLSEEGKTYLQDQVDHIYTVFVEDLARMKGLSVDQILAMADGKIFIGRQAVEIGLVDGVATWENVIEKMKGEIDMELNEFKTKYPALYQDVLAEGIDQGKKEGVATGKAEGVREGAESERKRITDMEGMLLQGHEALLAECKKDSNCTATDFAMKQTVAEKKLRDDALEKLKAEAPKPAGHDNPPEPGGDAASRAGKEEFMAEVDKYQAEKKCSRREALKAVAAEKPELHLAYLKKINPGREV